ncbi:MAG: NAD-dependent deacylase [Ignavibacteria bacterium]|nr:NAD-dependent deacylase [Ignavibacteria bacterium]
MSTSSIQAVANALDASARVCVLTGAGVSAESGVATFRDPDGLWARFSPYELASMDGFLANPERVRDWYNYRRAIINSVEPNAGHAALATLERMFGENFTLVTQNVDRLHQRAGSVRVLEVHGSIHDNRCNNCDHVRSDDELVCPNCSSAMRPNVVWFGEDLPQDVFAAAEGAARTCDVMLVVGTSADVWPAAGLPMTAKMAGAQIVEINPNHTSLTQHVHYVLAGTSAVILPQIIEAMT